MLERIGSWWTGKILVLVLLGFAATDFLITMTLAAADTSTPAGPRPPPNYSYVVTGLLCPARVVGGATRQRFAVPDRRIPSCSVAVPSPPRRPSRSYCSP
jgi:hypothetical protein